jgi:hypothetical protein
VFAPGAELDVFVGGDFRVTGRTELADRGAPARSRLYVAGSGEITLADVFVGNLYAPWARLTLARSTEVWGSLFAAVVEGEGYLSILYDRAISAPATPCELPLPAAGCAICGTCANGLACVDGSCGDCRSDADCCSQMVCTSGRCGILEIR